MSHGAFTPPDAATVPEPPPASAAPPMPAPGAPPPSSPPGDPALTYGPAPGPKWIVDPTDPRDWWNTRDRQLGRATIGLGAFTGAAFLASGGFLIGSYATHGSASKTDAGARITAVLGFLALPALIGVGTAWGVYRRRGWQAPPAVEHRPSRDPRLDPAWVARDRRLRAATIGLGVFAGATFLSIPLTLGIGSQVDDSPDCTEPGDCQSSAAEGMGMLVAVIAEASVLGFGLLALAGVGGARLAHRLPLRRWNMSLAPGGLEIGF